MVVGQQPAAGTAHKDDSFYDLCVIFSLVENLTVASDVVADKAPVQPTLSRKMRLFKYVHST
jgi:hypothetical protein